MNFYEMYTRVQNNISDSSSATLTIIKETLNLKAKELLQRGLFRFALRQTTVSTTSGTKDYYLPNDVDKILDIKQESTPLQLKQVWIGDFERLIPEETSTGEPKYFSELIEDRVLGQPTTENKVVMYSSDNQDISGQSGSTMATIYGVVSDIDRTENISLSATNVISSTNSYTKLYSITTDLPAVGTVRFTQAAVGTTLLELYPNETYRTYKKVKFYPIPNGTYTMYIRYQALQPKMVNNSDISVVPDKYSDVLIYMATAELLLRQGSGLATNYTLLAEQGIQRILKEQDMMWDFTPAVRQQDSSAPFIDFSYPFSYY